MKKHSELNLKENIDNVIAIIPVRGGSKGIPGKNIKDFCGFPLVYWSIKAANESGVIDKIIVPTDDPNIKEVVESFGLSKVVVTNRSSESVTDWASSEFIMLESAKQFKSNYIFLIQATSPLIEGNDLSSAFELYQSAQADSLLSVVRQKRFIWEINDGTAHPVNYNPLARPRRQDWDGQLIENGAFYLTSYTHLIESGCRVSGNVIAYEMQEDTYFEIDEPSDWIIAEQLKRMRISSKEKKSDINLFISDVDGVLTDAGMYYSTAGEELKKFNTRDGKGIELLRASGVSVMLLTSENIEIVERRAKKLNVEYVFMGIKDKYSFLNEFFRNNPNYSFSKTAYIGDDINDLECLQKSAFSATPNDGHYKVKAAVNYICLTRGGQGCVREVCDKLLEERGSNE